MKQSGKFLFTLLVVYSCMLVVTPYVSAANLGSDGEIVTTVDYVFPTFEDASEKTDAEKYCSKAEYENAIRDKRFRFQKLTYKSEGLKVVSYIYRPPKLKENEKLPAIVFNRGSFIRGDIAPELVTMFHRLATKGFIVLAPMYRGSDGGEGRDEMGGADMNDLMNVFPLAKSLPFIDTDNLFMYGESRGGMMTYQAVRRGFRVKAAAVFGAFTDMEDMISSRPDIYTPQLAKAIWSDYETRKDEIMKSRSALKWANELNSPILIMHGGNDSSVNPIQSLRMARTLLEQKKSYELIIYADDNHILSNNRIDRDARAVRWFRRYLKNR